MSSQRPHMVSMAAALLMLLPGIYCQFQGQVYRDGEPLYFGWPLAHPDNPYRWVSNSLAVNLAAIAVMAAAAGFAVESVIRGLRNRARLSLSSLFGGTAIVALLLQMCRLQGSGGIHCWPVDFIDDRAILDPIAVRYPALIMISILAGYACVLYSTGVLIRTAFVDGRTKKLLDPHGTASARDG